MEVDKIMIARRVLGETIRGWVRGDDVLTVHLSAMAAFMVTRDLRKRRRLGPVSIEPFIRPEARRDFWKAFSRLNNAIKHADEDPDAVVDISRIDGLTEMAILLAADNLGALEPDARPGIWVVYFRVLFLDAHPDALGPEAPAGFADIIRGGIIAQLDHGAFIEFARDPRNPPAEVVALVAALEQAARAVAPPAIV